MAERVGFEPTCRLPDKTLSRRPRYDHFGTSPSLEHTSSDGLLAWRRRLGERAETAFQVERGEGEGFLSGRGAEARAADAIAARGDGGDPGGAAPNGLTGGPDRDVARRAAEDERPIVHRVSTIRV